MKGVGGGWNDITNYVTNTIISASFLNRTAELLGGEKSNIAAIFAGELLPNDAHYKEKDWLYYK